MELILLGCLILFIIYVPKYRSETPEADVVLLHPKGIFAFESKSYAGWIFGSQGLDRFYNLLYPYSQVSE